MSYFFSERVICGWVFRCGLCFAHVRRAHCLVAIVVVPCRARRAPLVCCCHFSDADIGSR